MTRVIGVRFKEVGKTYFFDPGELEIKEGDGVIVETARGVEFGDVTEAPHDVAEEMVVAPLKAVERVATEQDWETRRKNRAKEKEAFTLCAERVAAHKLDMKLVDVEYSFNGSKIVFYFTADGRVDFRELVKDLASVFKTRIELRQIGVRDEAKMLGGLGSCGRPVCCNSFLTDFQPVSIKMAKEQNLSLSPTKISGLCGRLMCCLKYEQDAYESMRKQMPKVGKEIFTPDGPGVVQENNVITERTRVRVTLPDGTFDVRAYPFRELLKKEDAEKEGYPMGVEEGEDAAVPQERPARPPRPERPARPRKEKEQKEASADKPKEEKPRPEKKEKPAEKAEKPEGEQDTAEKPQGQPRKRRRRGGHKRGHGGGDKQNAQNGQTAPAPKNEN